MEDQVTQLRQNEATLKQALDDATARESANAQAWQQVMNDLQAQIDALKASAAQGADLTADIQALADAVAEAQAMGGTGPTPPQPAPPAP